jgi:uncharacterized Zn-finger protein
MGFSAHIAPRSWPDAKNPRQDSASLSSCEANLKDYNPGPPSQIERPMPVEVPEIIEVDSTRVACDGIGGGLGHPRVYLEMGDENFVECPYCDRRFVLRDSAKGHH